MHTTIDANIDANIDADIDASIDANIDANIDNVNANMDANNDANAASFHPLQVTGWWGLVLTITRDTFCNRLVTNRSRNLSRNEVWTSLICNRLVTNLTQLCLWIVSSCDGWRAVAAPGDSTRNMYTAVQNTF